MKRLIKKLLAAELGISRSSLDAFLSRAKAPRPDKAKKYDLDEVRKFIAASQDGSYDGEDIKKLKAKKVALECQRLQHEIDTRRGLFVAMAEITPVIASFNAELTANLRAVFEYEAPVKCVGKNEIEIRQEMKERIARVLTRLKEGQRSLADAPAS